MYGLLLALHLLVSMLLVTVVLVQSGKGGGLAGGAFGGATQTVFGGRGATDFITRATIVLGAMFFLTAISLALLTSHGGGRGTRSIVSEAARKAAATAPATVPAPGTVPGRAPTAAPTAPPPAGQAPTPVAPSNPK